MVWRRKGNITGPRGRDGRDGTNGRDGRNGVDGLRGPQGLPSPLAASDDEAVAGYISTDGTSKTKTALMNGFMPQAAIAAASYGMGPDTAPAGNVTAFNQAYAAALAAGRDLLIPSTAVGQEIRINGSLNVTRNSFGAGGVRVFAAGYCAIRQMKKPEPIFDVTAPNTVVSNFDLYGDGLDMTGMSNPINYARYAGVWVDGGANNTRVDSITGHGLHRAVRVDPDPTTTASPVDVPNLRGIVVQNIVSDRCWVAVSAVGFDDLAIDGVRGTYLKAFAGDGTDTGQPPHGIYVIDRTSTTPPRQNYSLVTTNCLMRDSGSGGQDQTVGAAAYAIKGVAQWTYDNLGAINCEGLLDLISIAAVTPGTAWAMDDVYPRNGGRASVAIKDSTGSNIRASVVAKAGGEYGRLVYVESTASDCRLDIDLTVAPSTPRTDPGNAAVRVSGPKNEVRVRLRNAGAAMRTGIEVQSTSAKLTRIIDPRAASGFQYPVEVRQGDGAYVEYDSTLLVGDPAAGPKPSPVLISTSATNTSYWNKVAQRTGGTTPINPGVPNGYVDTFSRPDSQGDPGAYTEDGQPYTYTNNGKWNIEAGRLRNSYAPTAGSVLSPAGGKADGTITIVLGRIGDANGYYLLRGGPLVTDNAAYPDWLRLGYRASSSDLRPVISGRIGGGTPTTLATAATGVRFADGDKIEIVMSGSSITVKQNGTTILTATDNDHKSQSLQGPWAASGGTTVEYESIAFTGVAA